MAFFSQLAQLLAHSGLERMRTHETEQQLEALNRELGHRVKERTAEIETKNHQLAADNRIRTQTEKALRENRSQLQAILDSSPIGIGWSLDGRMEYINNKFTELFGYQLEEVPTVERWHQLAYPDAAFRSKVIEPWSRQVSAAKRDGTVAPTLEAPVVCKGGAVRYVMVNVSWIGDRRLVNFSDITDRWLADQQNNARNTILELITQDAYWKPFRDLASRAGLAACWSEPLFSSKGRVLGTFAIYHRQPREPKADELRLIGEAANLASIAIEHFQALDELEHQAHTDSLTGLANRGRFMELAEAEMIRSNRYRGSCAVLLLDIDYFKAVNDRYGHKAGDLSLEALAALLKSTLREVDIIGRIGGEEFAMLLPETDGNSGQQVAERLRQAVENVEIATGNGGTHHLTVSIGVAARSGDSDHLEAILRRADDALYAAKHAGRNLVRVAAGN